MAKAREDTRHKTDSLFDEQLEFWQESLLVCLRELEVHDTQDDDENYLKSYNHAQECLDQIAALVGRE